ncbi:hypothetical protein BRE01_13470 [Brevibacillus reuszeri]|uniref:Uncharacterized protein n=1 Tax=Brevibacillus reuszeri TaxID=54915 RepID=A0A0K9Z147_9BACL|nr:hypothetical protein [Brevibacillus reuszeri]KNB74703.1 hypothetical protein ADS79_03200 [Brevibacillus reuszeri]MED1856658.1 hypothetical protein [Brevibacillus reuszeri]GED67645.1 hypothetical protein BRE01_13470 [Brevibacillus reuszeri]
MNRRPDDNQQTYLELLQKRMDVQAVLILPDSDMLVPFREGTFYIVVVNHSHVDTTIRRMRINKQVILEQQIGSWQLEKGAVNGLDERLAVMLGKAEILWDKDGYMKQMKQRISRLPEFLQKKYICKEYSRLLRFVHETKERLQQGMALDAYHSSIQSLDSWARLIVYEAGEHPQAGLWSQVKQLDYSVYKLYEELSFNAEALEKRIELLLLAMEFWITSRMKSSVRFLIEVMEKKNGPWSLQELMNHPLVQDAEIDIPLIIDKMVQRSLVQEVDCSDRQNEVEEICFILLG